MLLIPCPWCGPRAENEFVCGAQGNRKRPEDPSSLDDAQWSDYVFNRDNIKGKVVERWWHRAGCGRWFAVERDTVTHAIASLDGRYAK
jgi:sarcosine oxidase, subunit delta